MTIALTIDEARLTSKLNKVIHFAPCTVLGLNETVNLSQWAVNNVGTLVDLGIYSVPTGNWDADLATICDNTNEATCTRYSSTNANAWNRKP